MSGKRNIADLNYICVNPEEGQTIFDYLNGNNQYGGERLKSHLSVCKHCAEIVAAKICLNKAAIVFTQKSHSFSHPTEHQKAEKVRLMRAASACTTKGDMRK